MKFPLAVLSAALLLVPAGHALAHAGKRLHGAPAVAKDGRLERRETKKGYGPSAATVVTILRNTTVTLDVTSIFTEAAPHATPTPTYNGTTTGSAGAVTTVLPSLPSSIPTCSIAVTAQTTVTTVTVFETAGGSDSPGSSGAPFHGYSMPPASSLTALSSALAVNASTTGTKATTTALPLSTTSAYWSGRGNVSHPTTSASLSLAPGVATAYSDATYTQTEIIDTTLLPLLSASLTSSFTNVVPVTTTVGPMGPSGRPNLGTAHCGVHGSPNGNWRLAEYQYNNGTEAVTLEGCYQFCSYSNDYNGGCKSYDFFINQLNAPRCVLYGSMASYALQSIDNYQPDVWYDLICGDPETQKTQSNMRRVVSGGTPGDLTALHWE